MVDTEQMRHREYIILKTNTMCNLIIGVWNIIAFSWNVETQDDAAVCTYMPIIIKCGIKKPTLHNITHNHMKIIEQNIYQTQSDYIMVVSISIV